MGKFRDHLVRPARCGVEANSRHVAGSTSLDLRCARMARAGRPDLCIAEASAKTWTRAALERCRSEISEVPLRFSSSLGLVMESRRKFRGMVQKNFDKPGCDDVR
jgi:hypothetical protein